MSSSVEIHVLRLKPDQDLKKSLIAYVSEKKIKAASIVSAVGSLKQLNVRLPSANSVSILKKNEYFEIVSLSGTLSAEGLHLHVSVSDHSGQVFGGHLLDSNLIFTTAELVICEYPQFEFLRTHDLVTGYKELEVKCKS